MKFLLFGGMVLLMIPLAGVCRHDSDIFKRTGELILNELTGDGELDNATAVEEKMREE